MFLDGIKMRSGGCEKLRPFPLSWIWQWCVCTGEGIRAFNHAIVPQHFCLCAYQTARFYWATWETALGQYTEEYKRKSQFWLLHKYLLESKPHILWFSEPKRQNLYHIIISNLQVSKVIKQSPRDRDYQTILLSAAQASNTSATKRISRNRRISDTNSFQTTFRKVNAMDKQKTRDLSTSNWYINLKTARRCSHWEKQKHSTDKAAG